MNETKDEPQGMSQRLSTESAVRPYFLIKFDDFTFVVKWNYNCRCLSLDSHANVTKLFSHNELVVFLPFTRATALSPSRERSKSSCLINELTKAPL